MHWVHKHCEDVFALVKEAGLPRIIERLPPSDATQALRAARAIEVAKYIVVNERQFYTERIVLANAPLCIEPKLVRFLLTHGHQQDPDAVVSFAQIQSETGGAFRVHEVKHLQATSDPEIYARVAARHAVLLPQHFVSVATCAGMTGLVAYIHEDLALTQLKIAKPTAEMLARCIEHGGIDAVSDLFKTGGQDDVAVKTITMMMAKS